MSIGGPPGPGWWQATDGHWYAPELHPAAQAPPPAPPAPGWATAPSPFQSPGPTGPGYPPDYGYVIAPPPATRMPTWAIVVLCSVGGFFVLAVLAAIAIPTFLGVSNSAADRGAQADLNSALIGAKAVYVLNQGFPADTSVQLGRTDPSLRFVSSPVPSTSPGTVSVAAVPQAILMTDHAGTGTCWWILAVVSAPAGTGPGLPSTPGLYYDRSTGASCQASDYPTAGWQMNGYPSP